MGTRGGFVKVYRSLVSDPLWTREAFTRGQAWVDLMLLANYKPGHLRVRGNRIAIARGQVGRSAERLAERWNWSRGKVSRFLNELEKDGQIVQHKSFVTSIITITNYDRYQSRGAADGQQTDSKRTADSAADGTADGHQSGALIKKEKKGKNCKKEKNGEDAAAFARPTLEQVQAYCIERGNSVNPQKWFDHYSSNGWKVGKNAMKDWQAAVRTWEGNEYGTKPTTARVGSGQRFRG